MENIVVVGGGLMGAGIAQVAAQNGFNVHLVDRSEDVLAKSKARMEKSVHRVIKKKNGDASEAEMKDMTDAIMGRVQTTPSFGDYLSSSHLVVEAVTENLDLKRKIFAELDEKAQADCIFASNTSSLPIRDIATSTNRLERFGGLHFFNPVPVMKLVEVVRISETTDETYNALMNFGKNVGKVAITCKDTPGFVVNRLLIPYMMEAIRMLERGDATAKDIDIGMKLGCGYPMGPFELLDYVGLDTCKFIIDGWHKSYPEEVMFRPSDLLNKLVEEGKHGVKSGEGFYKY
eukprot:CAMPEP_0113890702 /NCGR_PEP_ID=MMETSP0780_2-20120614/14306_1 /TAXON_ID=652834 /ORGANISM="Palpitomonas bilix" /LENGTH=288 /DNA_ID=CAMNT_0000880155 /DNA_START=91 /DNA_END=957 /DNA_ORIENTATION=- /assembly_acc=CAM_ASM_000599